MTRRPPMPPDGNIRRAHQRMAPGGRLWSESPVKGPAVRVVAAGADDTRWWSGSWTSSTLTVPSGPTSGDLVFVVLDEAAGDNDYLDDPVISATWEQWAARGSLTWGVFTHDGRASYTISTELAGGAFVIVRAGAVPGGYDNLVDEGDADPIEWYGDSGETFTLTGTEQAHLIGGWAASDYDTPFPNSVGVTVADTTTSPIASPMLSGSYMPPGYDYWYAVGALVKST